ncbi:MAG TPA: pyridoxamine 5'-phosphate oxidase family protein [Streptosporangiaceae bacterium]|nr:pyridoxamine 5'-phosphate oxidase family protein [Streptosporangiaceae bacterium]
MATVYSELDERLIEFILKQPMFFVATAPCLEASGDGGHVNVSPKGYRDTFAVIDPLTVAYLDLTGSGAETIAHLRQNGRITIMFCSFDRQPKILRIYGTGQVILPGDSRWPELAGYFPATPDEDEIAAASEHGIDRGNRRAIIVVTADRISDSCGYAIPVMELTEERDLLTRWAERRTPEGLADYRIKHNSCSIDGLPALG